jgi:hypothetical protein
LEAVSVKTGGEQNGQALRAADRPCLIDEREDADLPQAALLPSGGIRRAIT